MQKRFYFTFGSADHFPFNNTYLVVYAENRKEAGALFRKRYPDYTEGVINCSDIYTQEEWDNLKMKIFYPNEPVKILKETPMTLENLKYIHESLREARYFAKEIRGYLYEIQKLRPLSEKEKEMWDKTHDIHIHTNNSGLLIQESNLEII